MWCVCVCIYMYVHTTRAIPVSIPVCMYVCTTCAREGVLRSVPGARGCMNAAVNAAANAASKAARTTSLQSPSLARFADTHRRWVQSLAPGCMYIYVITCPWMYGNHVDGCNPIYGNHLPLDICIFMYMYTWAGQTCVRSALHILLGDDIPCSTRAFQHSTQARLTKPQRHLKPYIITYEHML